MDIPDIISKSDGSRQFYALTFRLKNLNSFRKNHGKPKAATN